MILSLKRLALILLFIIIFIYSLYCPAFAYDIEDIKIHGFISQGYLKTDQNNYLADTEKGTFQFNEFGLNLTKRLSDKMTVGVQFFGRDMGTVGNDEVRIDWAYMDYRWRDWAGIRIGKNKIVYGLYNDTREIDMLRTPILLPQSVYIEVYRDNMASCNGIDFYGNLTTRSLGNFSYEFIYGAPTFSAGDGAAQSVENYNKARFNLEVNDTKTDLCHALAFTWETPLDGFRLRYSNAEVNNVRMTGNANATLQGIPITSFKAEYPLLRFNVLSGEYIYENLTLAAEYMELDLRPVFSFGPFTDKRNLPYMGWYISGSYRFNDVFTLGTSYSEFYPNSNDKAGDTQIPQGKKDFQAWQKTYTLSTRFDINEFWVLKIEASYNDGFGAFQPVYNVSSNLEPCWWLFAAKATVSF